MSATRGEDQIAQNREVLVGILDINLYRDDLSTSPAQVYICLNC